MSDQTLSWWSAAGGEFAGEHGWKAGWVQRLGTDPDRRVIASAAIASGRVPRSSGWARPAPAGRSASSISRAPTTRCSPRLSVWPRGAPGIAASFLARGRWRPSRRAVFPVGAPGASRIPPTYSPTLLCMRVMRTPPWRTTTARWPARAAAPTRSGWCGPCFTSRCARPAAHSRRRSGRCAGGGGGR